MDESDRRLLENIEKFGCQVMHISEEDELPPFAYSVGIQKTSGAPEVVVIGLKRDMAHFVVNEYNKRVREGEKFTPGKRYSGFIGDFEMEVATVHQSHYKEYFGYSLWFYKGPHFDVVQLVFPNTSGVWPWESEATDWFRAWQPILSKPSDDEPSAL